MRTNPMSSNEMERSLRECLSEIAPWDAEGRTRHKFPVTRPNGAVLKAIAEFWERNTNNIGAHITLPDGLRGTRRLESEIIRDLALLFHCSDAEGWLTTGGTEGNITALWLARERLATFGEVTPPVFCTRLTHDSIFKACKLLRLGNPTQIPLTDCATMDIAVFKHLSHVAVDRGAKGLIVVANVGATMTGTCDSVTDIAQALPPGVPMHLHVDAAFAGLVLPFSDPERPFDFRVSAVDSIVVDLHKMAQVPLGVGVFLARPGHTAFLQNEGLYAHINDRTLLGSRPGAMAAAAWVGINTLGRTGFQRLIDHCLFLKSEFLTRMSSHSVVHDPAVNIVAILRNDQRDPLANAYRIYFMPHLSCEDITELATRISFEIRL